jgi:diguanylate cyclase (GGDEF)-like protein
VRPVSRLGLLARFSVLSLIALVILGVVLADVLSNQIRSRALANAAQSAQLATTFGIQPQLSQTNLDAGLPAEVVAALDQLLRAGYTSEPVVAIRVWNGDRQIVYSPDHKLIGRAAGGDRALDAALAGHTTTSVTRPPVEARSAGVGSTIESFVPLRTAPGAAPGGAFEVYLKYAPVAAAISRDTRTLYVAIGLGLALLYAALFRIVWGASRRLRAQARENEHQAHHDALTGLPNRARFFERVEQEIAAAQGRSASLAVMILDLDRFKEVNDTLGHRAGDSLLRQASSRLAGTLRPGDLLARLGGDEFALLLCDLPSAAAATEVARRISDTIERPFELDGLSVHIESSIGIALYPTHGDDGETLLQRADVAMYAAKAVSENFETYSAAHDGNSPERLALLGDLRQALDAGELVLHYQPKANLKTGAVEGAEALVRWRHPTRGIVPPGDFIPLAEQTGLIHPLTAWVLDTALEQTRRWLDAGVAIDIAVNLSVRNLLDPELPAAIAALLRKWEVPPARLELEITESTIVTDQIRAIDVLTRLKQMGVGLAIDDFGTGYSSLAYLRDLPVRELKIDRMFVNNMNVDASDAFIVRSTIDLGRNLGLQVVAEGVETEATWAQLERLGCDFAQGFYLGRPMPAEEFASWIDGWTRRQRPGAGALTTTSSREA